MDPFMLCFIWATQRQVRRYVVSFLKKRRKINNKKSQVQSHTVFSTPLHSAVTNICVHKRRKVHSQLYFMYIL